ncbi:hypothetical protein [Frankia sp. EAN1pec]|uniref:hypothetical protein n=1 Tax=Parafrankia sp. (strain EAN1pec) TaxID=298653 RepID=UPI00059C93B2
MYSSTEAPGRSVGRTSADIGRAAPPGSDDVPGWVGAAEGREPGPAGDAAPSPPLPVRAPHATWPGRGLVCRGRGRVVRSGGGAGAGERTWAVVVLDVDGDPVETVIGFTPLDAADTYAEFDPDITRWTSVPSRPGLPKRIPGS